MNYLEIINSEREIFLNFMQAKYPMYYNSNIFLRDLQYAIKRFFETKNINLSYTRAEQTAIEFASLMENEGDFLRMDANSWKVNFHLGKETGEESKETSEESKKPEPLLENAE